MLNRRTAVLFPLIGLLLLAACGSPATPPATQVPRTRARLRASLPPPTSTVAPTVAPPATASATPSIEKETVLEYIPGSTVKLEQLLGEEDKELHQPTLSRTVTRYGLEGTDLGYSFEHQGRLYFLFGDTVGRLDKALDTIATTDSRDPEAGVRLDFLTNGRDYLTIQPPGISMGAFETPIGGISLNGKMYVAVRTNHAADWSTDRSVLTIFNSPSSFQPLRTLSQAPAGHFLTLSLHADPLAGQTPRLPPGSPFVFVWGTGKYRQSDAYLSIVPTANWETGKGTLFFSGLNESGLPEWSAQAADARPILRNGTMGDISVTWLPDLSLWLMTFDSREPAPRGVLFSYAKAPWGPWAEPQTIFNEARDGAYGQFIHDPRIKPDDGLAGPVIGAGQSNPNAVIGGGYAPYMVERWTRVSGTELRLYYLLSTWNPYVVVLMRSRFHIQ